MKCYVTLSSYILLLLMSSIVATTCPSKETEAKYCLATVNEKTGPECFRCDSDSFCKMVGGIPNGCNKETTSVSSSISTDSPSTTVHTEL